MSSAHATAAVQNLFVIESVKSPLQNMNLNQTSCWHFLICSEMLPWVQLNRYSYNDIRVNQEPITEEHPSTIGVCDNCPPLKEVINSP